MSDKTSGKSIVPSGKTDLLASGAGGNRLIRRAASDALMPMNSVMNRPEPILHRVGTREFHEEDFRQLQVWASELGMEGRVADFVEAIDEIFRDGVSSYGDLGEEYCEDNANDWAYDGRIRFFVHFPDEKRLSFPRLPQLTHLCWSQMYDVPAPKKLDLSSIPALKSLHCRGDRLTALNLSSSPALTLLDCRDNQLTWLDLSSLPALTVLWCGYNQLTELDIRCCLDLKSVLVDPWVVVHRRPDQTVKHPE